MSAAKIPSVSKHGVDLTGFTTEIRAMANWQYQCPQSQRLYSLPLSMERARMWTLQMAFWILNRRECWAFAQALAPMAVKKLIWAHEEDELAGNKERQVEDHYALEIRQAKVLGLTAEEFVNTPWHAGTRTVIYAWRHLVKDSPWLKSLAACAALEVSNSSDWVEGGGNSFRTSQRFQQELGISKEKLVSHKEHVEVDVSHGTMLIDVAETYVTNQAELALMLEGARETWELERVWKGLLADMIEALPEPSVRSARTA